MSPIRTSVYLPPDPLTDRWLIEAVSVMSSSPRVRDAAAAWLAAYSVARRLGCAEDDAHARADAALLRVADDAARDEPPGADWHAGTSTEASHA